MLYINQINLTNMLDKFTHIIDLSELIFKLEKSKEDFKKIFPKTYTE